MINNGQWREFDQDTGVTPLLFTGSAMGFLMTTESLERESQDLGLTSHPKDILIYTDQPLILICFFLCKESPILLQRSH